MLDLHKIATTIAGAEAFMNNVTQAISIYMRLYGNASFSASAKGEVFKKTTCVHVMWPWVTYPTVIVLLLLSFFVVML